MIPRPVCSCHGWGACVHRDNSHPDPGGRDEERGWMWHCPLISCEGYSPVLLVRHEWVLADLAREQRDNAERLLAAVREASGAGVTWREIGEAAGISPSAVFRQAKAGSPVVVVRASRQPQPDARLRLHGRAAGPPPFTRLQQPACFGRRRG